MIQAQSLNLALANEVRGLGTERGLDVVLNLLFVRGMTLQHEGDTAWADVAGSSTDDELAHRFRGLNIAYGSDPDMSDPTSVARTLRSTVRLVDEATEGMQPAQARELVIDAFEAAIISLGDLGKSSGDSDTPISLARLMVALAVRPDDLVLDPACGNGTSLLVAAQSHLPHVEVAGFDISKRVADRAAMRLRLHGIETGGQFVARPGDAFVQTASNEFDVVLAQPPWGQTTYGPSQAIRVEALCEKFNLPLSDLKGEMAWLALALDGLRAGGRAAVVLPVSSATRRYRALHEFLLESGSVEAVIALPGGLFAHTQIKSVLWMLRAPSDAKTKTVIMVDTASFAVATRRGRIELDEAAASQVSTLVIAHRSDQPSEVPPHIGRVVPVDELDLNRGLMPHAYLTAPPVDVVEHPAPSRTLLTEIELRNFKAFGTRTSVPLAPLTLVYGANSAGKSSIIQSLLLLRQSRLGDALITQGSQVNLGGFEGIVHGHASGDVEIGLTYGVLSDWIPAAGTPDPALLRTARWIFGARSDEEAPIGRRGALSRVELQFGEYELAFTRSERPEGELSLALDAAENVFLGVASGTLVYPFDARHRTDGDDAEQAKLLRGREGNAKRALRALRNDGVEALTIQAPSFLRLGGFVVPWNVGRDERESGIVSSYVNRTALLASGITQEVDRLLEDLTWLGPLRSPPQRVYEREDQSSLSNDGRHVAVYLFDHLSVVEEVNDWLQRLDIPYTLGVVPVTAGDAAHLIGDLVAISLEDSRAGITVTPADVGFGISQVLPIVVELLARRESVIAVEQPETHLHPRLQSRLADLFIDTTQEGGRGNQLIVETHSEHLMLRVQRRIREGALAPDAVSIVYVDQDSTGQATVQILRLDERGEFMDEWPQGFFDERLDELFGDL